MPCTGGTENSARRSKFTVIHDLFTTVGALLTDTSPTKKRLKRR